ncbi:MAG: hypothetical protein JWQ45_1261, partial [Blastococcus sp.]|nr:hypothetical protein [Blastococcus sp.]
MRVTVQIDDDRSDTAAASPDAGRGAVAPAAVPAAGAGAVLSAAAT